MSAAEFLVGYKAGEALVASAGVEVALAVAPEVSTEVAWGAGFVQGVEAASVAAAIAEVEYLTSLAYLKGLVAA